MDAEKSMFGPCGFDMGLFLANFAYYMSQVRPLGRLRTRHAPCAQAQA